MKTIAIQNFNLYKSKTYRNSKSNYIARPSFGFIALSGAFNNGGPSGRYIYDIAKLKILERSKEELIDLAEYLHKLTKCEIGDKVAFRYTSILARRVKDPEAYQRISSAVDEVNSKKMASVKKINELEIKKALGFENSTEQKIRINDEFLKLAEIEKLGVKTPITGGILLYGKGDKTSIQNWLISKPGFNIENYQHDNNNPLNTIKYIANLANKSDETFNQTKKRTILVIKDLDEMLSKHSTLDDIVTLGRFKNVMEDLKDRHLTVLTTINKPIESIEPSAIADHRFGLQLEIKPGISKDEDQELAQKKNYIKNLEKKSQLLEDKHLFQSFTID